MADGADVRATTNPINNADLQTFLHIVTQDLNQEPQPSAWLPKQETIFPDWKNQDQFRISCELEPAINNSMGLRYIFTVEVQNFLRAEPRRPSCCSRDQARRWDTYAVFRMPTNERPGFEAIGNAVIWSAENEGAMVNVREVKEPRE